MTAAATPRAKIDALAGLDETGKRAFRKVARRLNFMWGGALCGYLALVVSLVGLALILRSHP